MQEFFGQGIAYLLMLLGLAMILTKHYLGKIDPQGEIKEMAKTKAKSKILDWFK